MVEAATGTTIRFHTVRVGLPGKHPLYFYDAPVRMTPVIEAAEEHRWPPEDEGEIEVSWRGTDKLTHFELDLPDQIAKTLRIADGKHVLFDGWSEHWTTRPARWTWLPPFYRRARTGIDKQWPWFHWLYTLQQHSDQFVSVEHERRVTMDDGQTIDMTQGGFYLTRQGPPE